MTLIDLPRIETYERFALKRTVQIQGWNAAGSHDRLNILWGTTATLSEQGCQVMLTKAGQRLLRTSLGAAPQASPCLPTEITLYFPEHQLQLQAISIALTETGSQSLLEFRFAPLSLTHERALIQLLFCRPGQWQTRTSPGELRSLYLLLKTLFNPQHLRHPRQKAIGVEQA